MNQLTIDFEGNLVEQFPDLLDCVRTCVSTNPHGKRSKMIAADMEMSPSELSRRLSATDDLPFRLRDLIDFLNVSDDIRPILWLIEKYMEDDATRQKRAVTELQQVLPRIGALLKSVEGGHG